MLFTILLTLIVALISPAVFAGEREVTVPTPKSITLVCSDSVEPGSVVLTDPPKFSCKDYETIKGVIGLGITIGPDTRINQISSAIKRANRRSRTRVASNVPVVRAPKGPMKVRPEGWKSSPFEEESRPIPLPEILTSSETWPPQSKVISDKLRRDLNRNYYENLRRNDELGQWKPFVDGEYNRFDGYSRYKSFFRDGREYHNDGQIKTDHVRFN
jgi:hypothetical protein|tara:strand:- start:458 stop:1102 length:645 start_codon:yes stop_codon:yes gene_type:complete